MSDSIKKQLIILMNNAIIPDIRQHYFFACGTKTTQKMLFDISLDYLATRINFLKNDLVFDSLLSKLDVDTTEVDKDVNYISKKYKIKLDEKEQLSVLKYKNKKLKEKMLNIEKQFVDSFNEHGIKSLTEFYINYLDDELMFFFRD